MIILEEEIDLPSYFRRPDIEPRLDGDGLHIFKSSEVSDSGGSSHVVLNEEDLTSVLVGYYFSGLGRKARAKTRGGQFWRHYINGLRVEWREIPDETRLRILKACDVSAPPWAKAPGKLASERHKPNHHKRVERDAAGAIIGYKYLIWIPKGKVFRSMYNLTDSTTAPKNYPRWIDNFLESDELPREDNTNGIYAAKTFDSPILVKYSHILDNNLRLVRLLLSGTVLEPFEGMGYRAERADILQVFASEAWVDIEEFIRNEYRREEVQSTQDPEADQG